MRTNQGLAGIKRLLATLFVSLLVAGSVRAQRDIPAYCGKFTLLSRVHWGKSVLDPGDYTITIGSTQSPTMAFISKADGSGRIVVISGVRSGQANGANALLVREKHGELTVHSLSLASLGMVLIYDHSLAQEPVQEARASQSVPIVGKEVSQQRTYFTRSEGGIRAPMTTAHPGSSPASTEVFSRPGSKNSYKSTRLFRHQCHRIFLRLCRRNQHHANQHKNRP